MQRLRVSIALIGATLLWNLAGVAHAGGVKISPTTVTLSPAATSGTFVLTNQGPALVRFHISAFSWKDLPNGEMILNPTSEIVFFPAMVSLNPGEARKVRVGVTAKAGPIERSYRVFVQELPAFVRATDDPSSKVSMLTKMGIPVYFEGTTRRPAPAIADLALAGKSVRFNLTNRGTKHYRAEKITVKAMLGGAVLHSEQPKGWYVLAEGARSYVVDLPPAVCAKLTSVQIELQTDQSEAKAVLPNARCGP